jgi:hypothetical protein
MHLKNKLRFLIVSIGLAALSAAAQVPGIISHQGKVMVNGTNYTGSGQFKFALVDATGTTTYWSHDGSSAGGAEPTSVVTLPATRGVFSVNLGDATVANMTQAIPADVFTNSEVYLRTWFNDGSTGSQLLTPDRRITSVGYAMTAGRYTETDPLFAASAASGITAGQTNNWNAAYGWGNHAVAGYLTSFTETDPLFAASAAHGIGASDITAWNSKVGGSGTTGYVPKFTASGTVGNSVVVENGGNIGIGAPAPGQKLEVNGTIKSSSGGFMFPDGTVQSTATTNATSNGGSSPTVLLQAYLTTDVPLTQNTDTAIVFNNAPVNVNGAFNTSTGTFTVPATGIYTIQCFVVSTTAASTKFAIIKKGGAIFQYGPSASGNAAVPNSYVSPVIYTGPLTANDTITFSTIVNVVNVSALSGQSQARTTVTIIKW